MAQSHHILVSIAVVALLSLFFLRLEGGNVYSLRSQGSTQRPICVIVSTRPYHFDVTAFIGHHMQHLGFTTEVWLRSSFIETDKDGSYSLFKSLDFGIRDVGDDVVVEKNNASKTVLRIKPAFQLLPTIKVLVVTTADGRVSDLTFLRDGNLYKRLYASAEKILFIVHTASAIKTLSVFCMKPKCTMIVLAEHVLKETAWRIDKFDLSGLIDVRAFPTRTYALPPTYRPPPAPLPPSSAGTRRIVIQGSLMAQRRDYGAFFTCLTQLQQAGKPFEVHMLGWRRPKHPKLEVPANLASHVTLHENLKFRDYFPVISQSDLLVTFSNWRNSYYTDKATSSVPTGLNCGVGLVMPEGMLKLYPCLRDQPTYRLISKAGDCGSLRAAMGLNDTQLAGLKQESQHCALQMGLGAREVLRTVSPMPFYRKVLYNSSKGVLKDA